MGPERSLGWLSEPNRETQSQSSRIVYIRRARSKRNIHIRLFG